MSQAANFYLVGVGELLETSFLRQQATLSTAELRRVRARGAAVDSFGRLLDGHGVQVGHELTRRTLALDFEQLRNRDVALLAGGIQRWRRSRPCCTPALPAAW